MTSLLRTNNIESLAAAGSSKRADILVSGALQLGMDNSRVLMVGFTFSLSMAN